MNWIAGALIGALLGVLAGGDAWFAGAIAGGVLGWLATRSPDESLRKRLHELELRMDVVQSSLRAIELRLGGAETALPASPAPEKSAAPEVAAISIAPARDAAIESAYAATEPVPERTAPIASQPPVTRAPRGPRLRDLYAIAWRWLTGGNTVVRVGVVILFFGVAFLLKYAYARLEVPVALRLVGAALGAVALLAFGWRLRARRAGYALALQGGGVGILYLVIFASLRLYGLLPPAAAFALLVCVAAFSAFIAVAQDSLALAVLGVSGGFLAPVLASTGVGSHVALFSYYAVLNAGILGVALFKSWRLLNVVGYAFTFVIGALWGYSEYRPEHYASTQPFLLLFFLFYVAIPLLFARREAGRGSRYLDATLVFGVPLVAFGLQVALVRDVWHGAAWSALALGAFYLVLARGVWTRAGERMRMLAEAFLALGVVFATLAVPLGIEGRWTSAVWALEGAAILWVGVRQQRLPARLFGIALQFLAGLAFIADTSTAATPPYAIGNSYYLGSLFLAAGALYCAWYLGQRLAAITLLERLATSFLFAWGVLWWGVGGLHEIDAHVLPDYRVQAALLYGVGSCILFSRLHSRLRWRQARYVALLLLPITALAFIASAMGDTHPFEHMGYVAWPLAFVAHLVLLRWHDEPRSVYKHWVHAAGVWLWTALAAWEVAWAIDTLVQGDTVWPIVAWAIVPGAVLAFLALRGTRIAWPIAAWRDAYLVTGAAPLAIFLAGWWLVVNFVSDGNPAPLPYVPLLNPLDVAQVGAALVVALWILEGCRLALPALSRLPLAYVQAEFAAAAFIQVNAVMLRTLHHWAGVPFDLDRMLGDGLVQTAFSILWSLLALGTMVLATRHGVRIAWIAGAGLIAVVVAKLFLVDLASVGTIERIVSFLGVGLLMLIVGYFSPVPPRVQEGT